MSLSPGSRVGPYAIVALLGAGGMGEVYRARDERLQRDVAIKILHLDATGSDAAARRLLREARAAACLSHPAICTVHEVGEDAGVAYIAMELVDGHPLSTSIASGPLPADEVLRIARELAGALAHAHARGIVHGDLKPANVMLGADRRVTLLDFGLARQFAPDAATRTQASFAQPGVVAGTLAYMAPELLRGAPATAASDVWAIGAMLAEMAPQGTARPAALNAVIATCLQADPAQRYSTAEGIRGALDVAATGRPERSRMRVAALAAVPAIALAIALFGARALRPSAGAAATKLAVLPFENLTGDASQEFFSDGLTEEMTAQLGRLQPSRLGVIARTSAMGYKRTTKQIDQIGRELGVDYVLEGAALRERDRVRITAQLIRVSDQTQMWADSFERDLAGVLAVQSDVSRAVARALALTLLPDTERRLASPQRVNPEAYDAYLKGREHVYRLNIADLETALKYFEEALAKEPSYAPAYAGIANVWVSRQQMSFAPPSVAVPKAKEAAQHALQLDDGVAHVHRELAGLATFSDWDWVAGGREFERAIALDPNDADARRSYAHYLHIVNRPTEAVAQMARAIELDPLNPLTRAFNGTALLFQHKWDEAIAQYRIALRTVPNHVLALGGLGNALHHKGAFQEALDIERAVRASRRDNDLVAALDSGFAQGGYARALREAGDALAQRSLASNTAPIGVSGFYLRAGATDEALAWIKRSFDAHDPNIPYMRVHPNYDLVRKDPRFVEMLRRLNLP